MLYPFLYRDGRSKACGGVSQNLPVPDTERLDPPLLPEGECDKEPQFHQFGHGEMLVQFHPKRVVGNIGVPDNGARVGQRYLLTCGELRRTLELEKLAILIFAKTFPPSLDGSLDTSVLALNRL
jgi:hypothetical protein